MVRPSVSGLDLPSIQAKVGAALMALIKKSSSCFVSSVKKLLFLFLKRQNQVKAAGSSVEVAVISILFPNDVIS